jgi:diguanylate cyclase (GGDEF)-like protein
MGELDPRDDPRPDPEISSGFDEPPTAEFSMVNESDPSDSTQSKLPRVSSARFGSEVFRPVLICLAGPLKGQRWQLNGPTVVIGRSGGADWRINDSSASRRHVCIRYLNHNHPDEMPQCEIEDMGSRNGTEVNGVLIQGRTALQERDRILVGNTLIGFFVRDDAELRHDESLYESATRDPLTGLDNRRQMMSMMRHHLARVDRQNGNLCFLLLDLDHFKSVNDRFGHDVGDEALRHVAGLLARGSRESDLTARWGGEEFALCLPDTKPADAIQFAERLRNNIARSELMIGSKTIRMTVSIGGTSFKPGDDVQSLYRRADRMLYRAKHEGRNRTEFGGGTADESI